MAKRRRRAKAPEPESTLDRVLARAGRGGVFLVLGIVFAVIAVILRLLS
ncbi:MAG: hypothetical protein ACM3S1_02805 [Hyphomicrobiales bacterium]